MTDIEQLIEDLNSSDPRVRLNAVQQLKREPELPEEAIETLRMVTKDFNPRIADTATGILTNHFSGSQAPSDFELNPTSEEPDIFYNAPGENLPAPGDEPPQEISLPEETPGVSPGSRPKHPWFKIWIKPGETIREIINYDPHYLVIPITLIAGLGRALDRVMRRNMADSYDLPVVLLVIFIVGPIGGLVFNYIGGALFSWLGKKFGGRGSPEEVRTALAWPLIPWILVLVIDIFLLAIFGLEQFSSTTPKFDAMSETGVTGLVLTGLYGIWWMEIGVVVGFWILVLLVKCVAEAHQFSSWRSIATLAIPFFGLLLIVLICAVPILI